MLTPILYWNNQETIKTEQNYLLSSQSGKEATCIPEAQIHAGSVSAESCIALMHPSWKYFSLLAFQQRIEGGVNLSHQRSHVELLNHYGIELGLNNCYEYDYKTIKMSFIILEREAYLSWDHQKQKKKQRRKTWRKWIYSFFYPEWKEQVDNRFILQL